MPSLADMIVSGVDEYSFALPFSAIPCNSLFSHEDKFYIKLGDEQKDSGCLNPNLTIQFMDYDPVYKNAYCISSHELCYFKPDEDVQVVSKITFTQE